MNVAHLTMKLSLTNLIRRKQETGDKPAPKPQPLLADSGKTVSLARVRMQLLAVAVLLPGVLAVFCFELMSGYITRSLDHESSLVTQQVAARVSAMVELYGASLSSLAKDPDVARLLMSGNSNAIQAKEKSLLNLYPEAISVRLLPPGIEDVDLQASPPIGYAALTQIRAAEQGEQAPPTEVHQLNSSQRHVNIVRRVMDPSGSQVVGNIMLSLSNNVLQGILDKLQGLNGYIELEQTGIRGSRVRIAAAGNQALKQGDAERAFKIGDSRWQAAYWPAVSSTEYLGSMAIWVLGAFLSAATAITAVIMVLFRRLNSALRLNQASLAALMKDYRDGCVRNDYPSGLVEAQESVRFMTRLARNIPDAAPGGTAARAEKAEPDTHAPDNEGERAAESYLTDGMPSVFEGVVPGYNVIVEEDALDIEQQDEEEASIDASIFRAYDIRGVVDRTLTVAAVKLIGSAIGSEALQRGRDTIVVGRDGRLSGPKLVEALIAGITDTGCNVKDIGSVPTPVLYFATHYLDTLSGVVVTGSHNPPDYNGLKIVIDGETLSGESIQQLRERIEARNFISGQGSVETLDIVPHYLERVCSDIRVDKPILVAVDCGNGVAGGVILKLLHRLGCSVIELFCKVDGNFPNHHPDPSKPENLQDLINAVTASEADLGLAFDGDGDRLGVISSDGTIVWSDRVLMLYAMDILARNPGGQIIYDVKCTRNLDTVIREHGGEPLMWKTGHSFIKAKIRETGALLAGEMSGHIFFGERWYGFDDALYAAARLLEILGKDVRPAAEIFASLPDSVNTPELNVAMQEGEPPVFMRRLMESAHFDGATVSTIDGVRADYADGFGLVRASNTTPVLVLRFEADNDEALQRIMGEFRRVMLQVDDGLKLPF